MIFLLILFSSCQRHELCPYKEIEYNQKSTTINNENANNATINLGGKLEKHLKLLGKGTVNGEVKAGLNNLSKKIIESNIDYDVKYVQRWNAMVADICGKIKIFEDESYSDSTRNIIEKEILKRVVNFYEIVVNDTISNTSKKDAKKVVSPNGDKRIVKNTYLEISIQLEEIQNGFKDIYVNGERTNVLSNSTMSNPRIRIKKDTNKLQSILIITNNGDSCYINRIFSSNRNDPIRYIPSCKI